MIKRIKKNVISVMAVGMLFATAAQANPANPSNVPGTGGGAPTTRSLTVTTFSNANPRGQATITVATSIGVSGVRTQVRVDHGTTAGERMLIVGTNSSMRRGSFEESGTVTASRRTNVVFTGTFAYRRTNDTRWHPLSDLTRRL